MIRYSCHSENFGILSAEHTFSLIHDLQFDCIDIASRSLIPQNQIQADPAATSAYLKDLSQRYELPLSELFLSEVEVNGEKIKSEYLYLEPQVLPISRLQERINNIK